MTVIHEEDNRLIAMPEHTIDWATLTSYMVKPKRYRLISNNEPTFYITAGGCDVTSLHAQQHKLLYTAGEVRGAQVSLMDDGTCENPIPSEMDIPCQSFEPCERGRFVLTWEDGQGGLYLSVTPRRKCDFGLKDGGHITYALSLVLLEEGYGVDPEHADLLPQVPVDACCQSGRIVRYRLEPGGSQGLIELYHVN